MKSGTVTAAMLLAGWMVRMAATHWWAWPGGLTLLTVLLAALVSGLATYRLLFGQFPRRNRW
ncbi:MAG: hypothetical protein ACM3XM_17670 [Mycobacterium leprae]